MLPLRHARRWLVAGVLLLLVGLGAALAPGSTTPSLMMNDKLVHATGFLFFMLWFGGLFEFRFAPLIAVCLAGYGLVVELLQSLTPTRQAEGLDLVADVTGILLGWLLAAAGLSRWCVKLESWFANRDH